ncbi:hypothetical protein F2P56_034000 [Juglans regia]|uniref:Uncharacterized protein n=1 Tax=Juglans regia TaxID=51240 RepID=A0A833WDJ3_JUGRE|nr:hypothetical protein F2P56_034000 [Juglans regia]
MATSMEITTSVEGESSGAYYPEPIREFTEEELNIIKLKLTIYAGEAKKLRDRGSTSCIYRVLPRLKEINSNRSYEPNMVCIGPYYYKQREQKFQIAEDCKRKCLGSFLVTTAPYQEMQINTYISCLQRISQLEEKIRKCYSEEVEVAGIEFLEMMVVDACFIIEIIEMFRTGRLEADDSCKSDLRAFAWMVPYFYRDFLLLENQIPFFVLEEIYALTHNISVKESRSELVYAALRFFSNGIKRSDFIFGRFIQRNFHQMEGVPVLHLLDLVRSSLIPSNTRRGIIKFFFNTTFIHCISKLRLAGIKCHETSVKYFTVYATFLDCLVNTKEDVEYLRERNVIDNYLTDDGSELAGLFNRAGKDLVLNDEDDFYLGEFFEDVDRHYRNRWKWKWASFEREYIDKPWLLLSAAGGILLVVATLIQALMGILTYKYKNC